MASVVSALGERKGTRMERASGASSVDHVVAVAIISAIQIFAMQRSWARGIGEKRRMTSTTDGWTEREGTSSVTNISKGLAAVMMKLPFTSKQEGTDDFASRGTIEFVRRSRPQRFSQEMPGCNNRQEDNGSDAVVEHDDPSDVH